MTLPGRRKLFRITENGGPRIDASRKEEATRFTCFSHLIASPHRRNTHAATRPRITKKTPWGFLRGYLTIASHFLTDESLPPRYK